MIDTVYILFQDNDPLYVYSDPEAAEKALNIHEARYPAWEFYVESYGVTGG